MSKVAWIIFGSIVVLVLGGLVVYSRLNSPSANVNAVDNNSIIAASDQNGQIADHTFGKTDSKVVLVEYGDFQCTSCGGAHPQIKEITEEYKDRILFIFRNFPLTTIHPNARAAAAAVEVAGLEGKYWEMHNLIFETQSEWSSLTGTTRTEKFAEYAASLGLNKETFIEKLASKDINQKISFDQALGKKVKVEATPTFFLNGDKLSEEVSSRTVRGESAPLKALLDAKLAE